MLLNFLPKKFSSSKPRNFMKKSSVSKIIVMTIIVEEGDME